MNLSSKFSPSALFKIISLLPILASPVKGASVWQIVQGNFSWQQAKADAASRGGRLAVLDTTSKITSFNNYLASLGTWPELYIGLTDEETEGVWKWVNGEPLTANNWQLGQPNGAFHPLTGPEHYTIVIFSSDPNGNAGRWADNGATYFTNVVAPGGGTGGYVLEVIPEPSTLSLAGIFALSLGLMRKRRS